MVSSGAEPHYLFLTDTFGNMTTLCHIARIPNSACDKENASVDNTYLDRIFDAVVAIEFAMHSDHGGSLVNSKVLAATKPLQERVMAKIGSSCDSIQKFCEGYSTPLLLRFFPVFTSE